jgi:iron complex transport system substrate-binding protein
MPLARRSFVLLAVAGLLLPIEAAAQPAFPVTISHAHGETVIEKAPVRIVTWGWGNEDALVSLGVVPVGMPFQSYGGGEDGVQPWMEEALAALGGEKPVLFDSSGEPPVEQIAALRPDLILAVFSGITAEQYQLLSGIAPTVAYSGDAWSASWQDVILTAGKAIGKPAAAEKLVADTLAFVADTAAARPELAGTSFAGVNDYDGSLAVYDASDARVKFLVDLGLVLAPSVLELSPRDGSFYFPVSYELADSIRSDIIVTYAEEQAIADQFLAKPFIQNLPQYRAGAIAALVGTDKVAAVSPPTALSLRWGLADYADLLAAAARNAAARR